MSRRHAKGWRKSGLPNLALRQREVKDLPLHADCLSKDALCRVHCAGRTGVLLNT